MLPFLALGGMFGSLIWIGTVAIRIFKNIAAKFIPSVEKCENVFSTGEPDTDSAVGYASSAIVCIIEIYHYAENGADLSNVFLGVCAFASILAYCVTRAELDRKQQA